MCYLPDHREVQKQPRAEPQLLRLSRRPAMASRSVSLLKRTQTARFRRRVRKEVSNVPAVLWRGRKLNLPRVTFDPLDMASELELLRAFERLATNVVYVDSEKVTWDSVFSFAWCYEKKSLASNPNSTALATKTNMGVQHHRVAPWRTLPFTENSQWFCWGSWLNNRGDWRFDKERIRHELQKALYQYRFCPALQPELVEDALNALPDVVNPNKNKNWKFVERWGTKAYLVWL